MTISKSMLLVAALFLVGIVIAPNGFAGPVRAPVVDEVDEDAAEKPFITIAGMTKTCSVTCGNQTISCTVGKNGTAGCATDSGSINCYNSTDDGQLCVCKNGVWDCSTY